MISVSELNRGLPSGEKLSSASDLGLWVTFRAVYGDLACPLLELSWGARTSRQSKYFAVLVSGTVKSIRRLTAKRLTAGRRSSDTSVAWASGWSTELEPLC